MQSPPVWLCKTSNVKLRETLPGVWFRAENVMIVSFWHQPTTDIQLHKSSLSSFNSILHTKCRAKSPRAFTILWLTEKSLCKIAPKLGSPDELRVWWHIAARNRESLINRSIADRMLNDPASGRPWGELSALWPKQTQYQCCG